MTKRLTATRPILQPDSARAMYERNARPIVWTEETQQLVSSEFRALKERCQFDPRPDRVWDDAEEFTTPSGRKAYLLNCNGFAPLLKRNLIAAGLPEHALSLVICQMGSEGHMMLVLDTDAGQIGACNVIGVAPLSDNCWKYYEFLCGEARGRGWESYEPTEPVGLDKLLGK